MAPATTPKIEELRFRLKTDPKSRLFYPLAEELRKIGQSTEAESVLRSGLNYHPTYLSAWVSLGRAQRDLGNNDGAVESLTKALQLDPGNVVAARLLADAYLALGEKVEAIKKYKLVHALLPADQELEATIERLERELNPPVPAPVAEPEPEEMPWQQTEEVAIPEPAPEPDVFTQTEVSADDDVPMSAEHAESPFEERAADFGYTPDAFAIEQPEGVHLASPPLAAELPAPLDEPLPPPESEPVIAPELVVAAEPEDAAAAFEPAPEAPLWEIGMASDMPFPVAAELAPPAPDDFTKTITMADLYAKQGLVDEARDIYEDILARDPGNEAVRAKLEALGGQAILPVQEDRQAGLPDLHAKIARLEAWLAKVARRDVGRV
jgi:tetratricopeptide (TPR) repeat protein